MFVKKIRKTAQSWFELNYWWNRNVIFNHFTYNINQQFFPYCYVILYLYFSIWIILVNSILQTRCIKYTLQIKLNISININLLFIKQIHYSDSMKKKQSCILKSIIAVTATVKILKRFCAHNRWLINVYNWKN